MQHFLVSSWSIAADIKVDLLVPSSVPTTAKELKAVVPWLSKVPTFSVVEVSPKFQRIAQLPVLVVRNAWLVSVVAVLVGQFSPPVVLNVLEIFFLKSTKVALSQSDLRVLQPRFRPRSMATHYCDLAVFHQFVDFLGCFFRNLIGWWTTRMQRETRRWRRCIFILGILVWFWSFDAFGD